MPPIGTNADSSAAESEAANALQTSLTVPKEAQILFGIKTEPGCRSANHERFENDRRRARPDARAIVVPPVSGRIVLLAGNFVEITIDMTGNRKLLAVPKPAVVTEQGQTFVFVFNGGENFGKPPVALGADGTDFYEVRSGLQEGDRIVTEGVYQLRSTQPGA